MRTIPAAQAAILDGSAPGFVAVLLKLDLSGGALRLSTLPFDWVDGQSVTWYGAAGIVSVGEAFERLGVEGGAMTLTWHGADPDLMGAARDAAIFGATFTRAIATIGDNGVEVETALIDFVGECEIPEILPDPNEPSITLTVENELVKLRRRHAYRYTPEHHKRFFAGDTFFDYVADLQDKDIFEE